MPNRALSMIASPLDLFNYVVGHLIAFQLEAHVEGKDKGSERPASCSRRTARAPAHRSMRR